jgi:hypothetical protein
MKSSGRKYYDRTQVQAMLMGRRRRRLPSSSSFVKCEEVVCRVPVVLVLVACPVACSTGSQKFFS